MATTIGHESSIEKLVENLIYLERDAIAAYDTTIDKLEDRTAKETVAGFRSDHHEHLSTLHEMARQIGIDAPKEGDMKPLLAAGKAALARLVGDGALLKAMKTNEDDTFTAYERAMTHKDAIARSKAFFTRAMFDEARHRQWMQQAAASIGATR